MFSDILVQSFKTIFAIVLILESVLQNFFFTYIIKFKLWEGSVSFR